MRVSSLLTITLLAALIPLVHTQPPAAKQFPSPDWPTHFQGRRLHGMSFSATERRFMKHFPGRIARFTDGERDVVVRYVQAATRQLHPAADCYRGLGHAVSQSRITRDAEDVNWQCFTATRGRLHSDVCERIYDQSGQSWTDVSSWYWDAVLGHTRGPWWAMTVVSSGLTQPSW